MSGQRKKARPRRLFKVRRSTTQMSVNNEAKYIVQHAQKHDARIVKLGMLILFSTDSGDAWMLDPTDSFALCLARDGIPQAYQIIETETNFAIDWDHHYEIDHEAFSVTNRAGRTSSIVGYPVQQIMSAIGPNP
jgi:hypothetical protein